MIAQQANRGLAAELRVEMANRYYLNKGLALITKVPTKFVPHWRSGEGIVGAHVERKSIVDFVGITHGGTGIAFDVKECSVERWPLSKLEEHQRDFLNKWHSVFGGIAFVLLFYKPTDSVHVLTIDLYEAHQSVAEMTRQRGYKSLTMGKITALPKCESTEGCVVDYLGMLERIGL
ncbi:MAG: Holliday junction resolvase RecU [Chloroflexi bacterium]|nr:Holliday junction resolvase RecU [Chloroflexota bacterium]